MIELKKYERYPNVEQMISENINNCDYLAINFQILFSETDNQKEINFVIYFLLDCYEKKISILFDDVPKIKNDLFFGFAISDKIGDGSFLTNAQDSNKFLFLDHIDKDIELFLTQINTEYSNINNFKKLINQYIKLDILPSLKNIRKYLDNNNIDYNSKYFEQALNSIEQGIYKYLSEEYIQKFLPSEIYQINTFLLNNYLDNNLSKKIKISNLKI